MYKIEYKKRTKKIIGGEMMIELDTIRNILITSLFEDCINENGTEKQKEF